MPTVTDFANRKDDRADIRAKRLLVIARYGGSQMAFWTCCQNATSTAHAHGYDEYMTVVQGCCTLFVGSRRIPLEAGGEYGIPQGVSYSGEVAAGTRTIQAFGGRRAVRARRS